MRRSAAERLKRAMRAFTRPMMATAWVLGGCASIHDDGTTLTVTEAAGLKTGAVVGPLLVLALLTGLCFLPRRFPTLRIVVRILAIIGIVITLAPTSCCVPSLFVDWIEVTPTGIARSTGFWFAPHTASVEWKDVDRFVMEPDPSHGEPFPGRLWHAYRKDGSRVEIPAGDLGKSGEATIPRKIESLGVKVEYRP